MGWFPTLWLTRMVALGLGLAAPPQETVQELAARRAYVVQQWTMREGLAQNSVNAIAQSRDGYLWLGTNGGLVRFDGLRFTTFTTADSPGLVGNRILSLLVDSRGDLWIGAQFGGVSRYREGQFEDFSETADGSPLGRVHALAEDREGTIWAGQHRLTEGGFERVAGVVGVVQSMVVDGRGALWVGSDSGLFEVLGAGVTQRGVGNFRFVALTERGEAWFQSSTTPMRLAAGSLRSWSAGHTILTAQVVLPDGRTILSGDSGVYELEGEVGAPVDPEAVLPLHRLLGTEDVVSVRSLCVDQAGTLWCGTDGAGLFRVETPPSWPLPGEGSGKSIIVSDRAGGIWISFTRSRELVHVLASGVVERQSSPDGAWGCALLVDRDGTLWTRSGHVLTHGAAEGPQPYHLPVGRYSGYGPMVQDTDGAIWMGLGNHVAVLDGSSVRLLGSEVGYEPVERVIALACTGDGSVWIGSQSRLRRIRAGKTATYGPESGLVPGAVRAIHEASDGTLWIGSYGGGLARFDADRFTAFTTADGLPDDFLAEILEDDQGQLWVHCNRGLFRVPLAALAAHRPGGASLPVALGDTGEANGPTGVLLADGMAYLPTTEGVCVADTTRIGRLPPSRPVLERFEAGEKPARLASVIEVPPDRRRLYFQFTSPLLRNPRSTRFRYRLAGLHDDWLPAREGRSAFYESVPPGHYTFEVVAFNTEGESAPARIAFTVAPRFHETLAFQALLGAGILGLAALGYHLRVASIRRRHDELEREVHRRTTAEAELRNSRDRLRDLTNRLLHAQEDERRRIARELHDDTTQQLVSLSMDLSVRRADSRESGEEDSGEFADLARRARKIAGQVHGLSRRLHPSVVEDLGLRRALESEFGTFEQQAGVVVRRDVQIGNKGELPVPVATGLFRIAQECLRNVHQHAGATMVQVRLSRAGDVVELEVRDDGDGFDPDEARAAPGIGLASMVERAALLEGTLEIHSWPGEGSTLRARLPFPPPHPPEKRP